MLDIVKKAEGTTMNVALKGRLDTTTSPELESFLKENINGITELIFDLKDLEYISSAGLRVLLTAHKAMEKQGSMKLQHVNEIVMEVFEVTGFADILNIEE